MHLFVPLCVLDRGEEGGAPSATLQLFISKHPFSLSCCSLTVICVPLLPTRRDLRYCLLRFQAADADKDGALTLEEASQCLAMCEVEVEPGPPLVSKSKCDVPIKWELKKHVIGGKEFLVDHEDFVSPLPPHTPPPFS